MPPGARSQRVIAGLIYIRFAQHNTALLRLVSESDRTDHAARDLQSAGNAFFYHLVGLIEKLTGSDTYKDFDAMADVAAVWSITHGLADLLSGAVEDASEPGPADAGRAACGYHPERGSARVAANDRFVSGSRAPGRTTCGS